MSDDRTISERLAEEFAAGNVDLVREATVSAIPSPAEDTKALYRAVRAMKSVLDSMRGIGGSVLDKALTSRDLLNDGAFVYSPDTGLTIGGALNVTVSGSGYSGYIDPRPSPATPLTPTGLAAYGGFRSVILRWNDQGVANASYSEVWRHTADNLSAALAIPGNLIGQPTANLFEDTGATPSVPYYYWVRHVNTAGTLGPFSASVTGGALLIGGADFGPAVVAAAAIADGAVTVDKIADLALTSAKFAAGIEPVTLVVGSTVPTVKSTNVIYLTGTGKTYRWYGAGYTAVVPASDLTGTITTTQIADDAITAPKILAGQVIASKLYAGSVEADKIQAGNISAGAIGATQLAAGSVVAGKIAAGAITAGSAVIANGVITNAMIDRATVNKLVVSSADIVSVNADTITTGTLNASLIAANSLNANRIQAGTLVASQITSGTLNSSLIFAGALSAATGTFAGALSAATGTFSGALSAATGTFAGDISAATGTFSGSLNVKSASSGARMEITGQAIKVFDGTRLRVQLGDLSV